MSLKSIEPLSALSTYQQRNGTVSDVRPLRLVLLLCALIMSAPRSTLRLRPRTRLVPRRHRMACMPRNHARHVHPR